MATSKKKNKTSRKLNNDLVLLGLTPLVFLTGMFTYGALSIGDILSIDGHTWMNIHAISSLVIYTFVALHIIDHWGWYKKNIRSFAPGRRHLWIFSLLFSLTALTGIVILFFSGENSLEWLIHFHAIVGIVATYFVVHHIIKYFSVLYKWIQYKKKQKSKKQ